ncbi:apolipoprotein N-acyltransferase [Patescibacteria group bacterium]|nr:apolipoprotein N-acyltransferase [Patescibacteria group bacterium]
MKNNFIFLLPTLSGVLLILAYSPSNFGIAVLIALVPLLYFLSLNSITPKRAFLGGTITGIIFFGKLFSWFFATYPFEWLGIVVKKDVILTLVLVGIIWLAQIIFFGLFIGFFAYFSKKMALLGWVIFPCLWIVLEYLRAWGFELLWLGKEILPGPHWTFGNLAYTLHNNLSLIQISDIAGIYGISFLIVLINILLFKIIKTIKTSKKTAFVSLIFLILIAMAWDGYGIYKHQKPFQSEKSIKLALLQTNFLSGSEFNAYQKQEVFKAVLDLFQSAKESADIIIAPEGFGLATLTGPPADEAGDKEIAKYLLKDFFKPGQIYLENQKIIDENNNAKSRLFYYDLEKENPLGFHDKVLLVPGGDYLPYWIKFILKLYSFNMKIKEKIYTKGEIIEPVLTPQGNIGGTICSSILSPDINRKLTKKGAEFLVSVSSDAPFHGSRSLLSQNLAMSKIRAVENNRYFAQATNMGYSFLVNPKGQVISISENLGNEILFSEIKLIDKKTIYTQFGDRIIIFAIFVLIFAFLRPFKNYKISLDIKNNV